MHPIRRWLRDFIRGVPVSRREVHHTRARPGQSLDSVNYLYAAGPDATRYIAQYALNVWVYTAVARLAEAAAASALQVLSKRDISRKNDGHPILAMLGKYGQPNEVQDTLEFMEEHFTFLDLAGNSYWYWDSDFGGAPTRVYNLHPARMLVVPGRGRTVAGYIYRYGGRDFPLSPEQITHFKRPNPFNQYYGLPALEALMIEVVGDRAASEWNYDFFGDGVSIPAGIFVIPTGVPDGERDRLDREINAKHSERRRTAIVRADPGSTVWHDGSLKQRDLDFKEGRLLSRQAVMDALDLPLGILSDASTEAHARVAERRFYDSAQRRLVRSAGKLTGDVMGFWPGSNLWACEYENLRRAYADWQQENLKVQTLLQVMTVDEIRASEFGLAPMPQQQEQEGERDGESESFGMERRETTFEVA